MSHGISPPRTPLTAIAADEFCLQISPQLQQTTTHRVHCIVAVRAQQQPARPIRHRAVHELHQQAGDQSRFAGTRRTVDQCERVLLLRPAIADLIDDELLFVVHRLLRWRGNRNES